MSLLSTENVIIKFPSELSGSNTTAGVADSTAVCVGIDTFQPLREQRRKEHSG